MISEKRQRALRALEGMLGAAEKYWRPKNTTDREVAVETVFMINAERVREGLEEDDSVPEEILESLWRHTKGIDPETGKYWLTPRMLREAEQLTKRMEAEEDQ